jgi:hypothetical protein
MKNQYVIFLFLMILLFGAHLRWELFFDFSRSDLFQPLFADLPAVLFPKASTAAAGSYIDPFVSSFLSKKRRKSSAPLTDCLAHHQMHSVVSPKTPAPTPAAPDVKLSHPPEIPS